MMVYILLSYICYEDWLSFTIFLFYHLCTNNVSDITRGQTLQSDTIGPLYLRSEFLYVFTILKVSQTSQCAF